MSETGEGLGVMSKNEALVAARDADRDLVLITDKANPPIAKIIDLSKYKYQLSQQKAQERKNSHTQDTKEIRLTPFIDANDLNSKVKKVEGFLKKGHKVRLTMEFKGRAITKKNLGEEIFNQVVTTVAPLSTIEFPAKMIGKKMLLQLMPSKKGK
jgi:translation initiation factor IF-3